MRGDFRGSIKNAQPFANLIHNRPFLTIVSISFLEWPSVFWYFFSFFYIYIQSENNFFFVAFALVSPRPESNWKEAVHPLGIHLGTQIAFNWGSRYRRGRTCWSEWPSPRIRGIINRENGLIIIKCGALFQIYLIPQRGALVNRGAPLFFIAHSVFWKHPQISERFIPYFNQSQS